MLNKCILYLFIYFSIITCTFGQIAKSIEAKRTQKTVKIDGILQEDAWQDASKFDSLIEFRPKVGDKEEFENRTETYLMYDDKGMYFGGYCYERNKDSIASELVGRDGFGTNDYIGLILDTYQDKINGFEFFVTPLNEQWDAKMNEANSFGEVEDFSWNAVWESEVKIHQDGWSFEMFIPYSAVRFGKDEIQDWGINVTRRRRKTEEQFTWCPVNPRINGFLTQEGILKNITGIKPPIRLQFSPYFSNVTSHFPSSNSNENNWNNSINGGMDVKYGLNQAFTLDVTLIPDFGQVQSDNKILNLSPFEVRFTENRPFFTEGTEFFSKGDLFYSRRIGKDAAFIHSEDEYIQEDESVIEAPQESKFLNGTKISGRTANGLGIGFFNAVTGKRNYLIQNNVTKEARKELMEPLTNFNIMVVDQTLKNNSSISIINTNVWRNGSDRDANVTAGLFRFNDKKNVWGFNGKIAYSYLTARSLQINKPQSGYSHNFSIGKNSGQFTYGLSQILVSKNFNNNDLGYLSTRNFIAHSLYAGYNWLKPNSWYNSINLNLNLYYSRRLIAPSNFQSANYSINANTQLKNLWNIGTLIGYEPKNNNYFEPRQEGKVFKGWSNFYYNVSIQSNEAKKYNIYSEFLRVDRSLFNSKRHFLVLQNRYRFNNKLTILHNILLEPQRKNVGFAEFDQNDETVFGRRDIKVVENLLSLKYSFNNKMNINTRIRHYWSKVKYEAYYNLNDDGSLSENHDYNGNANKNYNIFNIDLIYTWQFAPGSFINVIWKNEAETSNSIVNENYTSNFLNTLRTDEANNFTLKIIYFLDYLQIKKWNKAK